MKANECMQVLAKHRGDAVVVCALGMAANEWWAVTRSEDSFYMHGGMGLASTFALARQSIYPPAQRPAGSRVRCPVRVTGLRRLVRVRWLAGSGALGGQWEI